MRIVHIITGLETGGAERALYNILRGGLAEKYDTHIISLVDEGSFGRKIKELGVPVTTLNINKIHNLLTAIIKLRTVIRSFKPNLIQGWMYHGNIAANFAAKYFSRGTPVIWNIRHSLYDLRKEKFTLRQVIRVNRLLSHSTDQIIYNSHISKQQHEKLGFSTEGSVVIPNGFDFEQWKPNPELRNTVRKEFGLSKNVKLVGHFARFHPMKDHATFLSAAIEVCKREKDTHFLLAGKNVDANNKFLISKIDGAMINRIHLLGERSDIEDLMPALDVFCLSSSWGEAFPNVLGEAMACGVPCVTTDVGDSKYIVGEYGLVVEPGDHSAMATAILSLLIRDRNEVLKDSQSFCLHILNNYSLSKIVEYYKNLYDRTSLTK